MIHLKATSDEIKVFYATRRQGLPKECCQVKNQNLKSNTHRLVAHARRRISLRLYPTTILPKPACPLERNERRASSSQSLSQIEETLCPSRLGKPAERPLSLSRQPRIHAVAERAHIKRTDPPPESWFHTSAPRSTSALDRVANSNKTRNHFKNQWQTSREVYKSTTQANTHTQPPTSSSPPLWTPHPYNPTSKPWLRGFVNHTGSTAQDIDFRTSRFFLCTCRVYIHETIKRLPMMTPIKLLASCQPCAEAITSSYFDPARLHR